jgi:hypothetical protein
MPYTSKRYKKAQLIAYTVPTLVLTQPGALPPSIYVPLRALTNNDEKARCQRFLDVAYWTRTQAASEIGPADTLKIFVVPEFYFRPTSNAYTHNRMINILGALKATLSNKAFEDWLFFAGTVFSAQAADAKTGGLHVVASGHAIVLDKAYLNTAVIVKGGSTDAPFHYFHKYRVSSIDGAPQIEAAALNPIFAPLLEPFEERRQRVFTVDNVTIGLDVCLDHAMMQVKSVVIEAQQKGQKLQPIDIHVITSCGMQIVEKSVAARAKGHVMLCDGIPNPSPPWERCGVRRVVKADLTAIGQATLDASAGVVSWERDVPDRWRVPQIAKKPWFTDHVTCFKPVAL